MFIVRLLFLFVIIHVYHHLLFDEFAPSVAKMKKLWAKHRVFVPASAHQLISKQKQPHVVSVDFFATFCMYLSLSDEINCFQIMLYHSVNTIVTSRQDKIIRHRTENHWEEYQKYNEKRTNRSLKEMILKRTFAVTKSS